MNRPLPVFDQGCSRAHGRFVFTEACLVSRGERTFDAIARNISKGGICLQLTASCSLGADVEVTVRNFDAISATVRWVHNRTYGLEFLSPISEHPDLLTLIEDLTLGRFALPQPRAIPSH